MADPESTNWIAGMIAAMGIGSGGGLLSLFTAKTAHETRIKRLEEDREKDSSAIQKTHTTVTKLDERTATILDLLKDK